MIKSCEGSDRAISSRRLHCITAAIILSSSRHLSTETCDAEAEGFLADKAKALKDRLVRQLGELVMATGADALDPDLMAEALLDAVEMKDAATKEGWRANGTAFFRGRARKSAPRSASNAEGALTLDGGAASG